MFRRNRHPVTTGRFRALLARRSILQLLVIYFLITAASSLLFGVLYLVTDTSNDLSWLEWWFYAAIQHLNIEPPPSTAFELNTLQSAVFLLSGAMGILLPALLLSSVVFKLFIADEQIMFSRKLWVYYDDSDGKYVLVSRWYNTSPLILYDISMKLRMRQRRKKSNRHLEILDDSGIKATFHTAYFASAPLDEGDIDWSGENPHLIAVNGNKLTPRSTLTVTVRAELPKLGTTVTAYREYFPPKDIVFGRNLMLNKKGKIRWDQWDKKTEEILHPQEAAAIPPNIESSEV